MKNRSQKSGVRSQKKKNNKILFICLLLLTAYCLLLAPFAESTEKRGLISDIERAVLKELKSSVSEDVEITGLRVVEGASTLESLEGYKVNTVMMNGYTGRNKMNFMVGIRDKRMGNKNIIVEASYDVLVDVFITSRPLTKGATLTAEDFYTVRQKSSKLPAGAVLNRNDIEKKVIRANIGQGSIIRADNLTTQLSIKRGQKVDVVVEGNNVLITTQGVLRGDAVIGGTAKVLCDISKKEVSGVLTSPNTVKVKI